MTMVTSVAMTIRLGVTPEDIVAAMKAVLEIKGHGQGETTISYEPSGCSYCDAGAAGHERTMSPSAFHTVTS